MKTTSAKRRKLIAEFQKAGLSMKIYETFIQAFGTLPDNVKFFGKQKRWNKDKFFVTKRRSKLVNPLIGNTKYRVYNDD